MIVPNRRNLVFTYKFTITGTAEGGATFTSPEFTLNTVCGPGSFDTTTSSNTIGSFSRTLTQTADVASINSYFLVESLANNWSSDCPLVSVMYETASGTDIASTAFIDSALAQPFTGISYKLEPVDIWQVNSYTFSIKISFVGGGVYRYAPCTLNLVCGLTSQVLTYSSQTVEFGGSFPDPLLIVLNDGVSDMFTINFSKFVQSN